jgi:hypothetical protein
MSAGIGPLSQVHHEFSAQASRQRERDQHAPRPARVRFTVNTQGVGETRLVGRAALNFDAFLLEEPSFSWGVEALQTIGANELPLCTPIVLRYIKNGNGLYTGAEMGFRVHCDNPKVRLKFTLIFEAATLRSTAGGNG